MGFLVISITFLKVHVQYVHTGTKEAVRLALLHRNDDRGRCKVSPNLNVIDAAPSVAAFIFLMIPIYLQSYGARHLFFQN